MKNFQLFSMSRNQQKLILGGKAADVTVNCPGNYTIKCEGKECTGSDLTGQCSCKTADGGVDAHACQVA